MWLVELLASSPGKTLPLAEGKSCIYLSRSASELWPLLSKSNNPAFLGEGERSKDSHNSCLNTAVLHVHIPLTAGPSRAAETQLWQDRAAARQRFRASGQQKAKHQPLLPAGTAAQPEAAAHPMLWSWILG